MHQCHFCKNELEIDTKVFRTSICPHCGKDLKICLNCQFYRPGAQWDCAETIDEPVRDKDRGNFCAYYVLKEVNDKSGGTSQGQKTRDLFDNLFNNK